MRELMEFVNYHLQFTKVKFNFLKKKKEQLLNEIPSITNSTWCRPWPSLSGPGLFILWDCPIRKLKLW